MPAKKDTKADAKPKKREVKAADKAKAKKTKESKSAPKGKSKAPPKADAKPEKKTRKKKDANAPKKPMCGFFHYQQERRNLLKKEQPELGHKELIKAMSTEWAGLNVDGKAKFEKLCADDK